MCVIDDGIAAANTRNEGDSLASRTIRSRGGDLFWIASAVSVCVGEYLAYRELWAGLIAKGDVVTRADAYRQTVIQIAGGVVVLSGLYLTYWRTKLTDRQTELTNDRIAAIEDGQVTERFTQAIEQLGSEKIEVRQGPFNAGGSDERGEVSDAGRTIRSQRCRFHAWRRGRAPARR